MNEVVPDWLHREDTTKASGTAIPDKNTIFYCDDAEKASLRIAVTQLQEEIRSLKAENEKLRKKAMTNMERIQTADKDDLAVMLAGIYGWGYTDAYSPADISPFYGSDTPVKVYDWLDKREWEV